MKFVHPESPDSSTSNGVGSSGNAQDGLGWLEFDSNLRITFTPLSASNNIILWCNVFIGGNNTGTLFHVRFATGITEGTGLGVTMVNKGAVQDSRTSAHLSLRQNNYDINDGNNYSFLAQEQKWKFDKRRQFSFVKDLLRDIKFSQHFTIFVKEK